MKSHFLKLGMRDAKLFRPSLKDNHRMLEVHSKSAVPRTERPGAIKECPLDTLLYTSLSNALHVLMRERPVPTVRRTSCPGSPIRLKRIDDLARESLVKITSGISYDPTTNTPESVYAFNDRNGKRHDFLGAAMMTRKSWDESRNPVPPVISLSEPIEHRVAVLFTWERLRHHIGFESYGVLMECMANVLGCSIDSLVDRRLLTVFCDVWKTNHPSISAIVEEKKIKAPWKDLLITGTTKNVTSVRYGYGAAEAIFNYAVVRGKETVVARSGEILVPVDVDDLELFRNGPGWATILEGGVLTIMDIVEADARVSAGFVPVYCVEEDKSCF